MQRIALFSMLVTTLAGGVAAAEPGDPVVDSLTMDRYTPISTVNVDLGYQVWDDDDLPGDLDVISIDISGHFVNQRGLGLYFGLPLTHVDVQSPLFDDSELALGNIEVGGLFTKFFGTTALLFHGGIVLPTAADDDGPSSLMELGAFTRLGDFPRRIQDSTWLRLGLSPMGRVGALFWRVDVGLDLALDEDGPVEYSPIFHVNFGGGVDLGSAQLVAELVNVVADTDTAADDSVSTLAVGARFGAGDLRPGVGLVLPLDADDYEALDFALVGSLAIRLP